MPSIPDIGELVHRVRDGDRRALARAISVVEDRRAGADLLLADLYPDSRSTPVVGITGAPGAGKSSLTSELISYLRGSGKTVAVLAVDPSSPFSGGAVLGDRIRMQDHVSDPGVYVRSMSTRGHLGGLADTSTRVLAVMAAAGFDVLIVETVGVGQSETEIVGTADVTVVVLTPGWGDGVQTAKAGLLEIADVFVINKADLPGCEDVERDLRLMLEIGSSDPWETPIVRTSAKTGSGIVEMWSAVSDLQQHLNDSDVGERRSRRQLEFLIRSAANAELLDRSERLAVPQGLIDQVLNGELDPWSAGRSLID